MLQPTLERCVRKLPMLAFVLGCDAVQHSASTPFHTYLFGVALDKHGISTIRLWTCLEIGQLCLLKSIIALHATYLYEHTRSICKLQSATE